MQITIETRDELSLGLGLQLGSDGSGRYGAIQTKLNNFVGFVCSVCLYDRDYASISQFFFFLQIS